MFGCGAFGCQFRRISRDPGDLRGRQGGKIRLVDRGLKACGWSFPAPEGALSRAIADFLPEARAGTTWSAKCYMNMRPLYQQHLSEIEAVA
jgi:hypothetical protein